MGLLARLIGKPRDLRDPKVFHHVSLIAFFAWVGLGADGLSSSAYGPEEAFRALNGHYYLAVFLAVAMAGTVFIISYTYSRIIEHFPAGGGGYVVASKLLGERAGVVSGCALLVDYVLTITISIASGANAVFALLPAQFQSVKVPFEILVIVALIIMNLRGVKESVQILTPIFLVFLITHVILIFGSVIPHLGEMSGVVNKVQSGLSADLANPSLGMGAVLLIFLRAYSLGGSAYTGIEAVSNGLTIMREPRVQTGKRTMGLMAVSLAFTAGGILLAYLLFGLTPREDEPMNATLAKVFAGGWTLGGLEVGKWFVAITMISEGALLFVAAQAGFIDGPRVMSNMALDSWLPHQLASLSERLTMRNGVYIMGGAAIAALVYTGGNVHILVVMYSINVFLTFALSNLGMSRFMFGHRRDQGPHADPRWRRHLTMHVVGFLLCMAILCITVYEKFLAGGWVTLVVTSIVIAACYLIRHHYREVAAKLKRINQERAPAFEALPDRPTPDGEVMDATAPTAVLLAGGYGGIGLQTLQQIERIFPDHFKQVMFISVGVIDSGTFKGPDEIDSLKKSVSEQLARYVEFARKKLGWKADADMVVGTDVVDELDRLCREVQLRFPRSVFFAGNLIFREPSWWNRILHNETAHAVQRRLEFDGLPMVIVPVRILK
jgi:amino acid transporter